MNLVIAAISAFLALEAALSTGSQPLAPVTSATGAGPATPQPTPTPSAPTPYDVIGGGGPT